jgi:hypothetical protein
MKKLLKIFIPLLIATFFLATPFAIAEITPPDELEGDPGVEEPSDMPDLSDTDVDTITNAIINIRNWLAGIILIIAVGVILIGAFMYMTSGGNEEKTTKARGWIVGGIIGIVVAAFAFGIVTIVMNIIGDVTSGG